MNKNEEKVLGIDLGTTYSCIAYIDENNKPVVLKNSEGELTTPSVVFFESENEVTVGSSAKESSKLYPEQVVSFIKRTMGVPNSNLTINGTTMSPDEISSYILKKCVKDAMDTLRMEGKLGEDEEIKNVVITCPAYFGINERTATQKAGEIAGLNVLQIINEPTAAAITYGVTEDKEEKTVLVYDLGGGTFDITMINIKPGEIKVICTGGDHNLGGKDWDDKILLYLDEEFQRQTKSSISVLDDPETLQELALSVEKAKKLLSSKEKAPIAISCAGKRARVELTREKFDELTKDLLERTIGLTKDMIVEAGAKGYKQSDINEILLVGGSSKMPQVAARVEKEFGIKTKMFDPDEAVAKGAAIYASRQNEFNSVLEEIANKTGKSTEEIKQELDSGKTIDNLAKDANIDTSKRMYLGAVDDVKIVNVTSRSFGTVAYTEAGEKKLFNLIKKNDELPAVAANDFFPMNDGQKTVEFVVMENLSTSEIIDVSMGAEVGKARLELPDNIKKDVKIHVEFRLNESGLLELKATEALSQKEVQAKFETKDALTDSDKMTAIRRMDDSKIN